jgi:uncharacterized membrane protein
MSTYVGDHVYDLAIAVYDGRGTADRAFAGLRTLADQGRLGFEEAAVFTRNERGKVKLDNKGDAGAWDGGAIGLGIGLLLGGPVGGAVVGGLIGFGRDRDRQSLRDLINKRLGVDNSALAVVVHQDHWAGARSAMEQFGGETVSAEMQGSSMAELEQLTEDSDVTTAAETVFAEITTD